jgi:hypothetical protein
MGRSLCGENTENAVLNSANLLDRENRRKAKAKRLFGVRQLPIVAAQTTD